MIQISNDLGNPLKIWSTIFFYSKYICQCFQNVLFFINCIYSILYFWYNYTQTNHTKNSKSSKICYRNLCDICAISKNFKFQTICYHKSCNTLITSTLWWYFPSRWVTNAHKNDFFKNSRQRFSLTPTQKKACPPFKKEKQQKIYKFCNYGIQMYGWRCLNVSLYKYT